MSDASVKESKLCTKKLINLIYGFEKLMVICIEEPI